MASTSSSLNAPGLAHLEKTNQVTGQIRNRMLANAFPQAQRIPYSWLEYEGDIHRLLESYLPQCILGNVKLFTPSFLEDRDFGLEVDNLLHVFHDNTDHLILIEAKHQQIVATGDEWLAQYSDGPKNVRNQIEGHIRALMEYLEPISKDVSLKIIYYVASSVPPAATVRATSKHFNAELYLIGHDRLIPHLNQRLGMDPKEANGGSQPRRISQSPFLDLLRLGFANSHLGHPEISSAVRYVERCRRELDQSLFRLFDPTAERWLINGSAGMGKSVLLAYAAAVLSSGYHLQKSVGGIGTYKAKETLEKIGFDLSKGALAMAANSQKQLDSLRYWFEYFVREFQKADHVGDVHFRRPEFLLFRDMKTLISSRRAWAAVFVDEAHDLPEHAAITLKQASDELGFYLIAACDRHQRLKLAGSDAKVIPGFNFERKSKRLRQVYRNPAPIYIASLALMFRWFSPTGPKVVPTKKQLEDCFGFVVDTLSGQSPRLTIKNDAHPANGWRHTIARFEDAATAATLLRREKLSRSEVLWVRFSAEDQSFDYEALQQDFTYHNCRTEEAVDLNDKYIKGQDYPVVVIEGFPRFMDQYADKADEDGMWAFRRELYLCASRATCFLFFICSVTSSEEIDRISKELDTLIGEVSVPRLSDNEGNGTREWSLVLRSTDATRSMDEYSDAIQAGSAEATVLEIQAGLTAEDQTAPSEAIEEVESEPDDSEAETGMALGTEISQPPSIISDEKPSDAVPIANAYGQWPIPDEMVPEYKWVLLVNSPASVRDFAERLGCSVPDLLKALKKRGLSYAPNSPIPVPIMRSVAFEFECYPANTQQEYDVITAEEAAPSDADADADEDEDEDDLHDSLSGTHAPPSQPEKKKWTTIGTPSTYKSDNLKKPSNVSASKPSRKNRQGAASPSRSDQQPKSIVVKQSPLVPISISPPFTVVSLAIEFGVKPFQIMRELIKLHEIPDYKREVSRSAAVKVAKEFGFGISFKGF
jgi:hypothetical protein